MGFFNDIINSEEKEIKKLQAHYNTGDIYNSDNLEVEFLEIEPLHTTLAGNEILIRIEPADLRIDTRVTPQYQKTQTYGRADDFITYSGTDRSFSIRFDMVKSTILDSNMLVSSNAQTINILQQLLYPSYVETATQNTAVLKTPPFFRIRYGNIIGNFVNGQNKGLTGVIKGLSVGIGKVAENTTYGIKGIVLPREYSISFTFDVIHEHIVGWYEGWFAGDGRNNYPFDVGIDMNVSPDAPGGDGADVGGDSPPGSPSYTIAEATQRPDINIKLMSKNNITQKVRGM